MHYTFIFTLLFFLFSLKDVSAENILIEFTKFDRYSIEVVHIDVGDKVDWVPKSNGHNVKFIAGPQMNALPKDSEINNFHSAEFKTPGVYLYGCTPHLNMGMLGLIIVGDDLHNLEEIRAVSYTHLTLPTNREV